MRPPILNVLTPWGWAAAALAGLIVLVLAAGALGFRWDPLRLSEKRLEQARAERDLAQADAAARRLERTAEMEGRARLDVHHRQTMAVTALTVAAQTEARNAPDADRPLDPERARRLYELDRGLCRLAPDLDGCAAASDPADGGGSAVRPGDPGDRTDPGGP